MLLEQPPDVGQEHLDAGRHVAAGQRDLEVELAEPVVEADRAEGRPARERTQRRVVQRHQGGGELGGRGVDAPEGPLLLDVSAQLGLEVVGERVGLLEHSVHQGPEGGARGQVRHR